LIGDAGRDISTQFSSLESFQTFGDLLKFLRRRERLTQLELSIAVGYSEAQIGRLEQNQRRPDFTTVKALFIPALHLEDEPDLSLRLLELARSARQEDAPAPGAAPYRGLLFFDVADADLFFGREALTTHLVERVTDLAKDASSRFLAVVGASGSGKSSLVRAGLAVVLQRLGWEIHTFTPTADPLEMLTANYDPPGAKNGQSHLLLVDQFEETFTLCRDENERVAFIERLLSIARDPAGKTTVVIALRADFYSHCAQYPLLRAAVAAEQEYIGQMTKEELRRAIEEPAKRGGWEFEPGLVDILLSDIGADGMGQPEPGALPLLSHALLATWERRRGRTFTLAGYHASGGVRGAIAETAESVYTDQLNQAQQELAHDIFLRLTELGEGTEDTRRRATLTELAHKSEEATQLRAVLNTLAEARLITLNEDTAEVAHEALIREWERLHEWLSQDREGLRLHRHLTDAALEWQARQQDAAELYRGARLAQTREWASANEGRLNVLEREFIAASIEQEQHEALEREAQRQRELEAARELAENQSRSAKQLRRRALFLAGAACLAAFLAVAAVFIAVAANNNARQSSAHQLASAAEAGLQVDSGQSISLTLQSLQIQPLADTYSLLHRALFSSHLRASVHAHDSDAVFIAISPAGDRLATSGAGGSVRVWRVNGGVIDPAPLLTLEDLNAGCKPSTATRLMFSPNGRHLAVGGCNPYISLVDAHSGELIRRFTPDWVELIGALTGLGFSPDGRWLAAFGLHGQITLWDVENGQNLLTFQAHEPGQDMLTMTCIDFSQDGRRLATGGTDGEVKLWSLEGGTDGLKATLIAQLVQKNEGIVQALRFKPDGTGLAEATLSAIHILDLAPLVSGLPGTELVKIPLNKNTVRLNSLYFTPAGDHLVSTQIATLKHDADPTPYENEVQIWDASTGSLLLSILPEQQLMAGVISPDGQTIYTAHVGGEIHSWDISNLGSPEGLAAPAGGSGGALNLSPDGKRLLVMEQVDLAGGKYQFSWLRIDGSQLATLGHFTISLGERQAMVLVDKNLSRIVAVDLHNLCRVFDAADGALLNEFQLGAAGPIGAAFVVNADASRLFMTTDYSLTDGLVEIWDIPAGSRLFQFHIPDAAFFSAFSPDGKAIVTYQGNNSAHLIRWWDPATGQKIKEIDPGQDGILGVVFTLDGKFWLSWGEDKTVKIHEAATDRLVRTISPAAQITSVIVSPDNHTIAVGLSTSQTTLYSFEDGHELVTLPGSSIVFSPDRPVVLDTISGDPTVYAFMLNNNDLVRLACERLKNITISNGDAPEPLKICQNDSQ
jgi:WD40 repeat protein/transcriptional regulator with XRE-family HTH domain